VFQPASLRRPRPVTPGATIGVFSPSGVVAKDRVDAGVATLEAHGFRVILADEALNSWRYFAGTDDDRLTSFHRMVADPHIDSMMMARGGYGWSRLIHRVDWQAVAASGKAFCGFSDFTAFNLAALAKVNYLTLAGPGVATDFDWRDDNEETVGDHAFMAAHLLPALAGQALTCGPYSSAHPYQPAAITGPLWGSNLSLIAHLVGTPFMPQVEGGILFIEEIDEQPYAIERMLMQLFHAGVLQRQRAVLFGDFSDCEPAEGRFPYALSHVIETLRALLPCPVLSGLPFGHVARKLTLPQGTPATLTITPDQFLLHVH
jgi:muramoyltetrapeptide carboxypeptidase